MAQLEQVVVVPVTRQLAYPNVQAVGEQLIGNSKYVWGGGRSQSDIDKGNFDCSSFVHYAFKQAGVDLGPLTSTSTETLNKKGTKIAYSDIQVGDVVFFDTYKKDGHVAIYAGNGKFLGAQSSTGVAYADMTTGYWKDKFSGHVRRMPGGNGAKAAGGYTGSSASKASSGMGTNSAKIGDSGKTVEAIQKAVGVYADGKFGKNTENAVKAFQKRKGIKADGVVGPDTWAAITGTSSGKNSVTAASTGSKKSSGGGSSYTNTHKTKKEALNAPGYQTYKTHLSAALNTGKVDPSWVIAMTELIGRESTWNPNATNGKYKGYGQMSPDNIAKYEKKSGMKYSDPVGQIVMSAMYIKDRYGTPERALIHHDDNNWYQEVN